MCGGFNYLALNELKRKVPKKGIEKVKSSIIGSKSAVAVGGGWIFSIYPLLTKKVKMKK